MPDAYVGQIEYAGGSTAHIAIDDIDAPHWRGTIRSILLAGNAPEVWFVGVHLLEGPHAGEYATADLDRSTHPPVFAGRTAFAPDADWDLRLAQRRVQQMSDDLASMPRHFEQASFTPYGLDDEWPGLRWFGGWGSSNGVLDMLELAHGDAPWDLSAPEVRIETHSLCAMSDGHASPGAIKVAFTQERKFLHRTGISLDEAQRAAFLSPATSRSEASRRVDLSVDEETVSFNALTHDDYWIAYAQHNDVVLGVESRGWPPNRTRLIPALDLRTYEEGTNEVKRRMSDRRATGDQ